MLQRKQPNPLFNFWLTEQLNSKNDHAEDKHEKTDSVDPMHIPYPLGFGFIRLSKGEVL